MENNKLIEPQLELLTAADIEPKEVSWLWYPYIPYGKLTMLVGDSGDGKSMFALNLAAILTRGDALPFTEGGNEPMSVIYINAEDGADDTVVPRFIKANGVRERLIFISEEKHRLNFSDKRIREAIETTGAKVCILDPLVSYLGGDVSMNLGNEVRPRLEYLINTARDTGCAIIVVTHINKAEGMSAKNRTNGSVDFVAAARSSLLVGRPPEEENADIRVMAHSKSNLAPLGDSILFSVGGGEIEFIDISDLTADQIVRAFGATKQRESKQSVASRELLDMLSSGPMHQKKIMERMKELGISQRTCELAKANLPIECVRDGAFSMWKLAGGHSNNATLQGNPFFAE